MTLLKMSKKIKGNSATPMDNRHHTDDNKIGEGKEGEGRKKQKSEHRNGNMVKNTSQPEEFKLIAGESLKKNFETILPHNSR